MYIFPTNLILDYHSNSSKSYIYFYILFQSNIYTLQFLHLFSLFDFQSWILNLTNFLLPIFCSCNPKILASFNYFRPILVLSCYTHKILSNAMIWLKRKNSMNTIVSYLYRYYYNLQKLMHLGYYPLRFLGGTIEIFLNVTCGNFNIFEIIWNFLQGKELVDTKCADFVSINGHIDKRVELDKSIKREDPKYKVALSMMASKVSYENEAFIKETVEKHWKMEVAAIGDYWNDYEGQATTQAFILLDKSENQDTYIVTFRGTELFDGDQWSCDFDISWLEFSGVGKTHAGFMKALGLQKSNMGWPKEIEKNHNHAPEAYYFIRDFLKKKLEGNDKAKFIVTGHSLGGALAILFPAILILHEETFLLKRLEGVYTFGQPRVGDGVFAKYMDKNLKANGIQFYRMVYSYDIVPRLPPDLNDILFRHFGTCLYFDRSFNGKKMAEEPNKNYFSLSAIIPMTMNAFCELIRSFTMVSRYGSEYQEGWVLRTFRFVGLAIPGVSNHTPQDYVNSTRLGSIRSKVD